MVEKHCSTVSITTHYFHGNVTSSFFATGQIYSASYRFKQRRLFPHFVFKYFLKKGVTSRF